MGTRLAELFMHGKRANSGKKLRLCSSQSIGAIGGVVVMSAAVLGTCNDHPTSFTPRQFELSTQSFQSGLITVFELALDQVLADAVSISQAMVSKRLLKSAKSLDAQLFVISCFIELDFKSLHFSASIGAALRDYCRIGKA